MTISEAITKVDTLKPNMYEEKDKIRWLSQLDARIYNEIILTHHYNEGEEEVSFSGYTEETSGDTELLVGEPYDEMYIHWLEGKVDYNNMEYGGFNSANSMFESVFGAFRNAYNASHMPKGARKIYY